MTKRLACVSVAALVVASSPLVFAAEIPDLQPDTDFPAVVVKTVPDNRAKEVDFALREITVTFDRPMQTDKAWSWIIHSNLGVYPGYQGSPEPRWEDEGKTCVLSVKLSPDTLYAVGVNSFRHTGFRDRNGRIAVPHVWVFRTRKTE